MTHRSHLVWLAGLVVACAPPSETPPPITGGDELPPVDVGDVHQGTIVGNPGSGLVPTTIGNSRLADSGVIGALEAELHILGVRAWPCDDGPAYTRSVDVRVDLARSRGWRLPLGRWCGIDFAVQPPFVLTGTSMDAPVALFLQVQQITISAEHGFAIRDDRLYDVEIGRPGWLDQVWRQALAEQDAVRIGPGDPGHDSLVEDVEDGSALYVLPQDALPAPDGPLATGSLRQPPSAPVDTGGP